MPPTAESSPDAPFAGRDLVFFCACALLLLPSIWSQASITGQDEYWLSFRTVLEMQERGEWLTPYVNGEVRLQKPPLLYWLMRCSFAVCGSNLFAARIWSVLAGALLALCTARLARRHLGSGYVAGLFVVGAAGVMIDARRAMFDLPVAALSALALYGACVWHERGALRSAVATGVALGLASMTKGPVALWFFVAPLLAALLLRRAPANGPWWHWLVGLGAFAAVALPWPLWVQAAQPEFWDVMATQAERRSFGPHHLPKLPKLLGATLGLIVPWSAAVLGGAWFALRASRHEAGPTRWLLAWVAIGLVPFAFMDSFERYTLGLVPAMAMLASHWLLKRPDPTQRLHATIAAALVGAPVVAFSLFCLWFGFSYLWPLLALGLWWMTWKIARRREPDIPLCAAMGALLLTVLLGLVYPSIGINRLPDDLPDDLAERDVKTLWQTRPGMLSILRGRSTSELSGPEEDLPAQLAAFDGYLFVLEEHAPKVRAAAAARGTPLEELGAFRSFFSRKAWLKFFRPLADDERWPAWREALTSRSADGLKPRFVYFRVGS